MPMPPQLTEPAVLHRVTLRLVGDDEREPFDQLLEARHSLANARLAGQTLRYVAELDGQWVALLCFSAAALQLKGREHWIRWSPRQRARRLGWVVNNSRFLVLPERQRYPNPASRVLGLALRRLSDDWQARWQHPVLVVESFVDESQYRGTCYRACGFEAVGLTEGYRRASRDFYQAHGQPKQLYLRELRPGGPAPCCAAAACRPPWRRTRKRSPARALSGRVNWARSWNAFASCATRAAVTACAIANPSCWPARPSPR